MVGGVALSSAGLLWFSVGTELWQFTTARLLEHGATTVGDVEVCAVAMQHVHGLQRPAWKAPLQLFGHRHKSRPARDVGFLRLHAGAVNPDREEKGGRPCYNLLDFEVCGAGADRRIEVTVRVAGQGTNK